jgi:hypothetical protein
MVARRGRACTSGSIAVIASGRAGHTRRRRGFVASTFASAPVAGAGAAVATGASVQPRTTAARRELRGFALDGAASTACSGVAAAWRGVAGVSTTAAAAAGCLARFVRGLSTSAGTDAVTASVVATGVRRVRGVVVAAARGAATDCVAASGSAVGAEALVEARAVRRGVGRGERTGLATMSAAGLSLGAARRVRRSGRSMCGSATITGTSEVADLCNAS